MKTFWMEQCPDCNGTSVYEKKVKCKKCKDGVYYNKKGEKIGFCPTCSGTGLFTLKMPCKSCKNGKVVRTVNDKRKLPNPVIPAQVAFRLSA